jgi:hypothetical protein
MLEPTHSELDMFVDLRVGLSCSSIVCHGERGDFMTSFSSGPAFLRGVLDVA